MLLTDNNRLMPFITKPMALAANRQSVNVRFHG